MQRFTALELFSLVKDSSLSWMEPKAFTLTCIPVRGSSPMGAGEVVEAGGGRLFLFCSTLSGLGRSEFEVRC